MPRGEIGEVVTKSPSSTTAYYKDEGKTKEIFKNGWIHTGDLGRQDEDGFLYIIGRTKDIIVSGGQNVFAPEVEEVIFSHPKVLDCAVVGLPDEKWVEKVTAVVIPKPGVELTEEEILEYCQQRIAGFKAPKRVILTDNIPKTATGKAQKFILVEKYK